MKPVKLVGKLRILSEWEEIGLCSYYIDQWIYWKNLRSINYWFELNGKRIDRSFFLSRSSPPWCSTMWSLSSFISKGSKISESGSNGSRHCGVLGSCNVCRSSESILVWLNANISSLHNLQYQCELFLASVNSSETSNKHIYVLVLSSR